MKILHISTGFPLSFHGGITNYVRNLADTQNQQGNEVYVLGGEDPLKSQYKFKYIEYKSSIQPFSLKLSNDSKSLEVIKNIINNFKFDIIHIHMMLDIDFDIFEIIKNENYIVSLHDYFYLCPRIFMIDKNKELCTNFDKYRCCKCIGLLEQNYFLFRAFRKLNIKLPTIESNMTYKRFIKSKKLLEGSKYLLPVSNRVKEIYLNSGIDANYKVMHIGNITAEKFQKCSKLRSNEKVIKFILIGTLNYMKGAELLQIILKGITNKNVEFHFWGRAEKKYVKKLKKNGLIFHGAYKQEELSSILKNFDIGLNIPVWEDNGPQVVMEMLNNGKPVVATKMGGITDFISFKNGYLFNPYDENEILKAIRYINNMDFNEINRLKSNIERTNTQLEHSNEIMKLYKFILK